MIVVKHVNIFSVSGHFYPDKEGDYQELRFLWCILITHSGQAQFPKALLQAFIDTEVKKDAASENMFYPPYSH